MKKDYRASEMLNPVPNVMVSVGDFDNANIITIGWTGIINSVPPRTYISVRPERHSYEMLKKKGEFVINLVHQPLFTASKICGSRSGRDIDKFEFCNLTKEASKMVSVPAIAESPVSIECKVFEEKELGTHTMFMADIVNVRVDEEIIKNGRIDFDSIGLTCYLTGGEFGVVKTIGRRE
jgi:flavin reductase (DIM6/NTAB) family NADH-FMN oxidoreductase RutF